MSKSGKGKWSRKRRVFTVLGSILVAYIVFTITVSALSPGQPTAPAPPEKTAQQLLDELTVPIVNDLWVATNNERAKAGLSQLNLSPVLSSAAQAKCDDMVIRDYWSHNTPDGKEPWVFLKNVGYDYRLAGENLGYGFATGSDQVAGWMDSPTHKANIVNPSYVDIGFAVCKSMNYNNHGMQPVIVQFFGTPR